MRFQSARYICSFRVLIAGFSLLTKAISTNYPGTRANGTTSSCLPHSCSTYLVQSNDNCWSIASANSIPTSILIGYKPSLNSYCSNLISGENICNSPAAGIYTPTTINGATVSPPGSIPHGTTTQCGKYYDCNVGDNCQQISLNNSITLSLFEAINPDIDAGCSNLVPGFYYCVFPTQDWNATASFTSSATATYVTAPAPTPSDTTNDCYVW